jgi:plasmid stabilization system protein ParE
VVYRLVILKTAADDAKEAYEYYEERQPGLGDRFLAEVLVRFNEISKHPHYYGFIDEQHVIRDIKLRSFPYLVLYEVEADKVIIYSVHCGYRHPDKRIRK